MKKSFVETSSGSQPTTMAISPAEMSSATRTQKRYVCSSPNCGKFFRRKDYLTRHELNHNGIRPFKCEQCNLKFTRSDLLEKHFKSKSHQSIRDQVFGGKDTPTKRIKLDHPATDIPPPELSAALEYGPLPEHILAEQPPHIPIEGAFVHPPSAPTTAVANTTINSNTTPGSDTSTPSQHGGRNINNHTEENPFQTPFDVPAGFIDNFLWLFSDLDNINEINDSDIILPITFTPSAAQAVVDEQQEKLLLDQQTKDRIISLLQMKTLNEISLARYNDYLDLYWFNFHQTFPIIHRATFNPNTVNIYLLVSIIIIGMAHSLDKVEYETSINISKTFRNVIFDVIGDKIKLTLPLIQALLFHNFACKNFGDSHLYQMAQIFHGTNINFLRFSGFFDNLVEPIVFKQNDATEDDLMREWHNWIYYESCKRTAFFAFVCDSQHATFSKLQTLSAFDIKLELPCTDEVWISSNPLKFYEEYERQPKGLLLRPKINVPLENKSADVAASSIPTFKTEGKWPSFLWSLRSMILPYKENQKEYSMDCYSQYSRYIVLHGLMSICWDMRWRGLLDLGIVSKKRLNDLSRKLEGAFFNWKGYFDLHIRNANQIEGESDALVSNTVKLNNYGPSNAFWANISLFQTALISLYADTASITKFTSEYKPGSSMVFSTNQDIKVMEAARNKLNIEAWARSSNGVSAVYESAKFLRMLYDNEETIDTFSHVPWTAFISSLVIWCYEIKRDCPHDVVKESTITLSYDKYVDQFNNIDKESARNDAYDYFSIILDSHSNTQNETAEMFWEKQTKAVGVVCYVLHLLRNCKWYYTVDLVQKLEQAMKSYDNK